MVARVHGRVSSGSDCACIGARNRVSSELESTRAVHSVGTNRPWAPRRDRRFVAAASENEDARSIAIGDAAAARIARPGVAVAVGAVRIALHTWSQEQRHEKGRLAAAMVPPQEHGSSAVEMGRGAAAKEPRARAGWGAALLPSLETKVWGNAAAYSIHSVIIHEVHHHILR